MSGVLLHGFNQLGVGKKKKDLIPIAMTLGQRQKMRQVNRVKKNSQEKLSYALSLVAFIEQVNITMLQCHTIIILTEGGLKNTIKYYK